MTFVKDHLGTFAKEFPDFIKANLVASGEKKETLSCYQHRKRKNHGDNMNIALSEVALH